jgi:hypothetical protein
VKNFALIPVMRELLQADFVRVPGKLHHEIIKAALVAG